MSMDFAGLQRKVEQALPLYAPKAFEAPEAGQVPAHLAQAMGYSLLAGGKRIRPVMLLLAVQMLGGPMDQALPMACALEMIHTYSLIHDDLPCMDNDDLRRGRPTCHVVYGEAQALLAGDGLLTHAFEIMLKNALAYPENARGHLRAMAEIAEGAGVSGMVGGQVMDLLCEKDELSAGEDALLYIHRGKTGGLFRGAMAAGYALSGADEGQISRARAFGDAFGMLFQAVDDYLDSVGSAGEMGKSVGKDAQSGKLTYVSLYGLKETEKRIERLCEKALGLLEGAGGGARPLCELVAQMASRRA